LPYHYTWNDRLLLTASMRADGSSKFGANNRWGYFPAISVAYRLNDMVDVFDDLKVRAASLILEQILHWQMNVYMAALIILIR